MPVTKDQAHMLASLATACRPTGAPRWDEPGVVAAIGKVAQLALADVAMAVIRAACDRDAKTPGVIGAKNSLHWAEKVTPPTTPRNPTPTEACTTCGQTEPTCRIRWAHDHDYTPRPPKRADPTVGAQRARAALHTKEAS